MDPLVSRTSYKRSAVALPVGPGSGTSTVGKIRPLMLQRVLANQRLPRVFEAGAARRANRPTASAGTERRPALRLFGAIVCLVLTGCLAPGSAAGAYALGSGEVAALQRRLTDAKCYAGPIDGTSSAALDQAIDACPSQDPQLRIETGMHTTSITSIGVDAACRIAATGAEDKTVRVWSLPDGRLLRTLRVPIGDGDRGKIYATAVSPDGRWIAAGGWDAKASATRRQFGFYVFDAATGIVAARIGGFQDIITHLAFSADGRWLAATSEATFGVKVIDTSNWRVVMADAAYAGDSYGAAFGPDGRLYTVAEDGKLRRYGPGPSFARERQRATGGSRQPYSVAIDPRGKLVAVGFADSTKVGIFDAATLAFRYAADTSKFGNGSLARVAWWNDGARLVAGGEYSAPNEEASLATFDRAGRPLGALSTAARNSVHDIVPCGEGFALATADPAFGLVDGDGRTSLWRTGATPDVRRMADVFAVSADGRQVRFGLAFGGAEAVRFDLTEATLSDAPTSIAGLAPPRTDGLPISWSGQTVMFAGKPIALNEHEVASSFPAVRADGTGFVLGAAYSLRAFDAAGRQSWLQDVPGYVWDVNLSADGRLVVAAYGDGTIRWHRWSDGKELLALFVNRSTKAWVAWTPSGYYMASPGGEDMIGWHVNRGFVQAADFFPASRFRGKFSRPDVVRLVLATLDEGAAIEQANALAGRRADRKAIIQRLPPVIRIADPADSAHVSSGDVTIDYAWRSPSGQPVDRIDVLIDGRPVKAVGLALRPAVGDAETTGSIHVSLTHHDAEVGLIAWSGEMSSQAVSTRVVWDGAPAANVNARKLYALVVGVSDYVDPDMALHYAAKDARDFGAALVDQRGGYYSEVETRVLTDRAVTRSSIIEGLQWLSKLAIGPDDVGVLFLAGHGLTDVKQTYWFLPSDATVDNVDAKGVSQDELRRFLENLPGKVLWFLDTCHAGGATKRPPVDMNVLVNAVTAAENGGIVAFASSRGREVSIESSAWQNGAFTKAIVEGIGQGKADLTHDGKITTSLLDFFLERRVQELTDGKQQPVMGRPPEQPDFTVAQVRVK